jgi:CheY-like chemotaxis protein
LNKVTHILYADDDEDDHIFFREAFHALNVKGYEIVSVYDGAELLNFLRRKADHSNARHVAIDLLILDLNMPIIDGFGILKELKSNPKLPKIPVYILSVSDKEDEMKRCKELGCAEFYTKPVNFSKLQQVIRDILLRHTTSESRLRKY